MLRTESENFVLGHGRGPLLFLLPWRKESLKRCNRRASAFRLQVPVTLYAKPGPRRVTQVRE